LKGQLGEMMATHAQTGCVTSIGLRSARHAPIDEVTNVQIDEDGLVGDHGRAGKRAVTLLQAEHLPVIAALAGKDMISAAQLRRNLVISGLNLLALRKGLLRVGDAILEIYGPCPPCSRMEKALGAGGYNAMRGHGGWYASVAQTGQITVGDQVAPVQRDPIDY
jgi:MOSC domain-containing protein YiiM